MEKRNILGYYKNGATVVLARDEGQWVVSAMGANCITPIAVNRFSEFMKASEYFSSMCDIFGRGGTC